ncbi:MAG: 4Fe-4S dicluster domain-containing protein [Firmicutes bacterium]|nr:4Fe-4S dicluster domain-containing protein [Bacillota bacterium]
MTTTQKVFSVEVPRGTFYLFPSLCKGCGLCKEKCPKEVMTWSDRLGSFGTPTVDIGDPQGCISCGICQQVCPDCAITVEKKKAAK